MSLVVVTLVGYGFPFPPLLVLWVSRPVEDMFGKLGWVYNTRHKSTHLCIGPLYAATAHSRENGIIYYCDTYIHHTYQPTNINLLTMIIDFALN